MPYLGVLCPGFKFPLTESPFRNNFRHITENGFDITGIFVINMIRSLNPKTSILYLDKLRQKKQTKFQIQQASDAIALYYEMVNENIPFTAPKKIRKETANDAKTPFTASVPKCLNAVQDNSSEYPRPSPPRSTIAGVSSGNLKIAKAPPKTAQKLDQESSGQKPPLKAADRKTQPPQTGANWKPAFDALRDEIKVRHYSPKTLKSYTGWLRRFQAFAKSKPLETLSDTDLKDFLTFLAVKKNVAASTQNQAFNALLFFFRHVLKKEPGEIKDTVRAKRKPYAPVVLSRQEIDLVLQHLSQPYGLIVGHSDIQTTMIYTHVIKSMPAKEVKNPLDFE